MNRINRLMEKLMKGLNDDLNPDLGVMSSELRNYVPSPAPKGQERNEYDNKKVRDFDLDDFSSYAKDKSNPNNGKFDPKDKLLSYVFVNGFIPDMDKGSNINANKNFNKYKSWRSALYDIWTYVLQMNGSHQNLPKEDRPNFKLPEDNNNITNEKYNDEEDDITILSVSVKKPDVEKFKSLIDKSDFSYDSFNKEFNSFEFPVDGAEDADSLEKELEKLVKKIKISVSYESY